MIFLSKAAFVRNPKRFFDLIEKSGQIGVIGDLDFQIQFTRGEKLKHKINRAWEEEEGEFGGVIVNRFSNRGKFNFPFRWDISDQPKWEFSKPDEEKQRV